MKKLETGFAEVVEKIKRLEIERETCGKAEKDL